MEEIPTSPNISDLPGNYVQLVAKNLKKAASAFPSNIQPLICMFFSQEMQSIILSQFIISEFREFISESAMFISEFKDLIAN